MTIFQTEDKQAPAPLGMDQLAPERDIEPSFLETVGASFRLYNTPASLMSAGIGFENYGDGPKDDPDFDPFDAINGTKYADYPIAFATAHNMADVWDTMLQIDQEEEDRATLSRSGWVGTLSMLAAGGTDPINFVPFVGTASKARGVVSAARTGAAAAGISTAVQEGVLSMTQATRTPEESLMSIGGATLLGGFIGAGIGGVNKLFDIAPAHIKERYKTPEGLGNAVRDDAFGSTEAGIPVLPEYSTVGSAQRVDTTIDEEGIARFFPEAEKAIPLNPFARKMFDKASKVAGETGAKISPLLRMMTSPFVTSRRLIQDLVDVPMMVEKNRAGLASGIEGGGANVQNLKEQWMGQFDDFQKEVMGLWTEMRRGKQSAKGYVVERAKDAATMLKMRNMPQGQMSFGDFLKETAKAARRGDVSDNPFIAQAAKAYRKLDDSLKDEAVKVGLFEREPEGVAGAMSHVRRVWDKAIIKARPQEFTKRVTAYLKRSQDENKVIQAEVRRLNDNVNSARDALNKYKTKLKESLYKYNVSVERKNVVRKLSRRSFSLSSKQKKDGVTKRKQYSAIGTERFGNIVRSKANKLSDLSSGARYEVENIKKKIETLQTRYDNAVRDLGNAVSKWGGKSSREAKAAIKTRDLIEKEGGKAYGSDKGIIESALKIIEKDTSLDDIELRSLAQEIMGRIVSTPDGRLPYDFDLGEEASRTAGRDVSGMFKSRQFAITDEEIEDFLLNDILDIAHAQVRGMSGEIELARYFGDTDLRGTVKIKEITDEYNSMSDEIGARIGIDKKLGGITQEEAEKLNLALRKKYEEAVEDFAAIRDRLRGTYGIPENPDALSVRVLRAAGVWNVVRLLGMMTISSASDVAGLSRINGISAAFKDGIVPFMKYLSGKEFAKVPVEELQAIGIGTDIIRSARFAEMMDINVAYSGRSLFERTLNGMSNAFGLATLMDPWNSAMKTIAGMISMQGVLKACRNVVAGKATQREVQNLASQGIDAERAKMIWAMFQKHGDTHEGMMLPNTDAWDGGADVKRLFRSAIQHDVNKTIVTVGPADLPLFISKPVGKAIMQFKSFPIAATQRILIPMLIDHDKHVLNSMLLMTGLGMMSYAATSALKGREMSDNPLVWVTEGMDRAGYLGITSDVLNTAGKLAGFGGTTRYQSRNQYESLFGPTFGLGSDLWNASGGTIRLAKGQAMSKSEVNSFRRITPLQNLWFTSKMFDKAQKSINEVMGNESQ